MIGDLSKPELLFELARGGMGAVHLARVGGLGGFERFVVVKRILDATGRESETFERFLSEARIAAGIHHANVVGTHHVGTDEAGLYMVLDYIEGGSLAALTDRAMLRGERMPIPIVLRIALDALAGLSAVHRATGNDGAPLGIVHRDVSLQNLLVGRDGVARLTDFGIARSTRGSIKTKTGSLIGKLLYLPPEHIRQEPTDHTIDIYMLGVTLWCALTGEEPWPGTDEAQLMHRILNDPLPSVASRRQEPVAPEIEQLIRTAAHPVAKQRYPSAAEMAHVIESLGRERGWVASQHEVATFVEGLLGVDLDRRRARIAQLANLPTPKAASGTTPQSSKSATRWLLGTAALLLLLVAAIALWPTEPSAVTRNTSRELQREPSPNNTPAERTAPPVAGESAARLSATAGASTALSTASLSAPTATASVQPAASIRNPMVAKHEAPPSKAATPKSPPKPAAAPSAPDDVSPRNPYR